MKRLSLLLIFTFCLTFIVNAQSLFRKNYTYSGGFINMGIPAGTVEGINTNTYLIAGTRVQIGVPLLSGTVSKLDVNGAEIWSYQYFNNLLAFNLNDIKKDPVNSNYYLCGGSDNGKAVFFVIDDNGDIIRNTELSIANSSGTVFNRAQKTSDGGYIVVGAVTNNDPDGPGPEIPFHSHSYVDEDGNPGGGTQNIYSPLIVKLDSDGNEVWHEVFRFYKTGTLAPTSAIHNTGQFYDVVEVADGFVAVGSYKVNDWTDAGNGNGDETPTDALILKTDKNGNINYLKQIDSPNTSTSQNSKSLAAVNITSGGDVITTGIDKEAELVQKFRGTGGFLNIFSRKFEYGNFLFSDPVTTSQIYEIPGSTDLAVMGMHVKVLPPQFSNFVHRINSTATSTVWNKQYLFGLSGILPSGSMTADDGFLALTLNMTMTGFKYQLIRTDNNGDIAPDCQPGSLSSSAKSAPGTFADPYYKSWSLSSNSANANLVKSNIGVTIDEQCIIIDCIPPAEANSVTATSMEICNGGNTTISASGTETNVSYHVYDAATGGNNLGTTPLVVSPTSTTTYYIETVRNEDPNCVSNSRIPITITVNDVPNQPSAITGDQTVCSGASGTYSVVNVPGVTYTWTYSGNGTITGSGNSISLNNITTSGTLTVTPSNACGDGPAQTVAITVIDVPNQPSVITGDQTVCSGASGTYSVANVPGVTYTWTYSGSGTITGSGNSISLDNITTDGTLTVTPSNTCGDGPAQTVAITVIDVPNQPSAITGNQTVCSGASGTYSVVNVPGVTYTWTYSGSGTITGSGNSISLDNITSDGTLTVTPSNTCGDGPDQTIAITVIDVPNQPSVITGDQIVCNGNSGNYSVVDEGVTYTWTYSGSGTITGSGNSISLDNITSGGTLTVTPSNTCGDGPAQTIVITIGTGPTIDNIAEVDPSCGNTDGEITITVSGSTGTPMYSIDNGANFVTGNTFTGLGVGTYIVVVTDDTGCENSQTVDLTNLNGPSIDDVVVTPTACITADGTITITASGGTGTLEYSIDNGTSFQGNGTFTGLGAGTYNIVVRDDNDCETTSTATIIQANAPSLALVSSQDITCHGDDNGSIVVEATGGTSPYTYNWTPNVSTTDNASDLPAGDYTVTVTDDNGCSDNLQVTINEPTAMVVTEIITAATCGQQDGSIALQVNGGDGTYIYAWTPNVSTTATATGIGAGQYEVTVTDGNGCVQTHNYTVGMEGSFYAEIIPDNITINEGESIDLHLAIDSNITVDSIIWSPSAGLSCTDCTDPIASPATTTTYYVQIISDDGCIANDSITITIKSPCAKLFVPTSFSPNGDGVNDFACIMGDCILTLEYTIYNRWGEVVFYTDNQKECWDGMFRGKMVQSGVYVYKLNATLNNGEEVEESGNINVVR